MEVLQVAIHPKFFEGRKTYALRRMRVAIDRAIHAKTAKEKEAAARWAAAWGTLGGIPPINRQRYT